MSATLPTDVGRELAALRARAYGPDADIATDPAAQARLAELETIARGDESQSPSGAPTPSGRAGAVQISAMDGVLAASDSGAQAGLDTDPKSEPLLPAARSSWWRHPGVFMTVGVALAGGFALGLALPTVWTSRPDIVAGIDRDAPVDPTEAWIRQAERVLDIDPASLQQYEQVQGVTMWTGQNAVGARCLIVAWGELWGNGSCAPDPLDPVVDFRVNPDIPMPLAAPLAEGGVVRFVARGDVVEIWVREPVGHGPEVRGS